MRDVAVGVHPIHIAQHAVLRLGLQVELPELATCTFPSEEGIIPRHIRCRDDGQIGKMTAVHRLIVAGDCRDPKAADWWRDDLPCIRTRHWAASGTATCE